MAYNFTPIDFTQGLQNIQNQWNTVGNAFKDFGQGLSGFGQHYDKWDEMLRKQNAFNSGMEKLQNSIQSDKDTMQQQADIQKKMEGYTNAKKVLEDKAAAQNKVENNVWNDDSNNNPLTYDKSMSDDQVRELQRKIGANADGKWGAESDALLSAYNTDEKKNQELLDKINAKPIEDKETNDQIGNLDWGIQNAQDELAALAPLSAYAKYLSDPAFEAAVAQAKIDQSFDPITKYINGFTANDQWKQQFDYTKERDAKNDAFRDKELELQKQAKQQEGLDAELSMNLDDDLSYLNGLNFGRDGRVRTGPKGGQTMKEMVSELVAKYRKAGMSDTEIFNTIKNHKTMSAYSKLLATRNSTPKPESPFNPLPPGPLPPQ